MISEQIAVDRLKPHPKNYRSHPPEQLAHIIRSIEQHGVYKNIVTAKDYTILAGHGVWQAATQMGLSHLVVVRLNIEPDHPRAIKLVVGDNEISNLAADNERVLTELLKGLGDAGELLGTGYDEMQLTALALTTRPSSELPDVNAAAEWAGAGMPEYEVPESGYKAVVFFRNKHDRATLLNFLEIREKFSEERKAIAFWFPEKESEDIKSVRLEGKANVG